MAIENVQFLGGPWDGQIRSWHWLSTRYQFPLMGTYELTPTKDYTYVAWWRDA